MNIFFILFLVFLALSLLSMGMIGALLFILVTPAINFINGTSIPLSFSGIDNTPFDCLKGDSTWPTMIIVGMIWSLGFLILAGIKWKFKGLDSMLYLSSPLFLWLWAVISWQFVIKLSIF